MHLRTSAAGCSAPGVGGVPRRARPDPPPARAWGRRAPAWG